MNGSNILSLFSLRLFFRLSQFRRPLGFHSYSVTVSLELVLSFSLSILYSFPFLLTSLSFSLIFLPHSFMFSYFRFYLLYLSMVFLFGFFLFVPLVWISFSFLRFDFPPVSVFFFQIISFLISLLPYIFL